MKLSVKETKKLDEFIDSVRKRINDEQNSEPHSAASTRIVNSSDPSRSPFPGSAPIRESIVKGEREKRKSASYMIILGNI